MVLVALALITLSGWTFYRIIRVFRDGAVAPVWWAVFALFTLAGLALGIWLAFSFEYQASPRMRVVSFPLPIVFFVWEEDRWTDFVTPDWYMYPALAANVCITTVICAIPVLTAFLLRQRQHRKEPRAPSV
jgi:hypothetical protein